MYPMTQEAPLCGFPKVYHSMNLEGLPSAGQLFSIWTSIFVKFKGAHVRLLGCIQAPGLIVIKWGETRAYTHTDV